MNQQIPLADEARADAGEGADGTRVVRPDLAYRRLAIANVVFVGEPRAEDGPEADDRPGAGDRSWVLVDAGVVGTAALIRGAARARFGDGARPSAIVLTHGHFDHVGALEELAEAWDVPVYAHERELPYLNGTAAYPPGDPGVGGGLMAGLSGLYPTRPVDVSARLRALPADGSVPGLPGWRWLPTPGHSPGHVSLWRESDRALIAGDAVVTTAAESAYATAVQSPALHGPPRYFTIDWRAARASVRALAALHPALLVAGHGRAMRGEAMDAALQELAADFDRLAVPARGRYLDRPARAEDGSAYRPPGDPARGPGGSVRTAALVGAAVIGLAIGLGVLAASSRGTRVGQRQPARGWAHDDG